MIEPIPRPDQAFDPGESERDVARPPATGLHHAERDGYDTLNDAAETPKHPEVPETRPLEAGIEFSFDTSFDKQDDTNEFRAAPASALSDLPEIPNYEVQSVLGRGGMGVVLKARHRVLGRIVAIKLPLVGQFVGAEERERFLREARAAAKLHHRQICPIHEVGQIEGRPYLVLQFLAGKTLHEWSAERKPSARESASLLARVARAVGYAHQHGVVHRDLKPANVMIEAESDEPVLMDFGLAKELGDEASLLTQTGQVMGTPAYMAPEQAAGRVHEVGPPSDIYALGAILYELICGQRPFLGGAAEVLRQVVAEEPLAPRTLNPRLHVDLETICLKALAKNPGERYDTAIALADDLERFAAGEPILARRQPLWRKMARRVRRSAGVAAALAVLGVALASGGYLTVVARNATHVANLKSQFEKALETGRWSLDDLAQVDALAAEIARLDRASVDDLNSRILARLTADIQREVTDTPARELDLERAAQLEERITLLDARDPHKAGELRRLVQEYLGGWKVVFDFSAQSDDLSKHFAANQIKREGGALMASPAWDGNGRPRVLTTTGAQGPARLDVVFDSRWETAQEVGLLLTAGERQEYAFVLSATDDSSAADPAKPLTLADARRKQGQFAVAVYRNSSVVGLNNDTLLKADIVPADSAPAGPLRLRATRNGERLSFEINGKTVLECVDLFPLAESDGDAFGLRWPAAVGATRIMAERLLRGASNNPLERGDQFFATGDWSAARQQYERARLEADEPHRQEVDYKVALCDLREGSREKALRRFDELMRQPGARWPLLAACQVWLEKLRNKNIAEANAQFDLINAAYRDSAEAALALPEADRSLVIGAYAVQGAERLQYDESITERSRRAEQVLELVGAGAMTRQYARMDVIQSLAQVGDFNEALRKAEAYLVDISPGSGHATQLAAEYAWIAIEAGNDYYVPLTQLDRIIYERPGVYRPPQLPLLVERARLHAAQNNWGAAEADLDEFDRARPGFPDLQPALAFAAAEANLVRGFVRERRGDMAGATSAWRDGIANLREFRGIRPLSGEPLLILSGTILASHTDTPFTTDEFDFCYQAVTNSLKVGHPGLAGIVGNEQLMRGIFPKESLKADLLGMWRSPRGRQWARRLALRNASRRELILQPLLLLSTEHIRQASLGAAATDEQLRLASLTGEALLRAALDNALDVPTIIALAGVWKGGWTAKLLWKTARDGLASQPELRGLLAYFVAQHLILKSDWANCELLFRGAVDDAPSFTDAEVGTALGKLAQFELDQVLKRKELAALAAESKAIASHPASSEAVALRRRLLEFWRGHIETPLAPAAFQLASGAAWPADLLRRENIPPEAMKAAGFGDPNMAPRELVAVLGDGSANHWESISALAVSRDGRTLATGSGDGNVKLWSEDHGRLLREAEQIGPQSCRTLVGHRWAISCLAFSPDDELLATGSHDGTVRIWSVANASIKQTHQAWVNALVFTGDGKLLLGADGTGKIRVWDVASGVEQQPLEDNASPTRALALVDRERLAASHDNGEIRLWNLRERKLLRKWLAHSGSIGALAASGDGRWLVSGGGDRKLKVWDLSSDAAAPNQVMDAGAFPSWFLAFGSDDQTIVSACGDGALRRFDGLSGEAAPPIPSGAYRVAFDAPRNAAVESSGHNQVNLIDLPSGQSRPLIAGRAPATSVAWSSDGTALATAHADGTLTVFDAAAGKPVRTLSSAGPALLSLAFSPDGQLVAAGRADGNVLVFDASPREFAGQGQAVGRLAFSPTGDMLASADSSGAVKLWKVADGAPAGEWKAHDGNVTGLAFTPDDKVLATAGADTTIRTWNRQGNELPTVEAPAAPVVDLAIDPTGRWLAAVENSGAVKLWGLADRKVQFAYPKPNGTILPNRTVTFSPDGQCFATAGSDGQVRIYDPRYYDDELPFPQAAFAIGPPGATIRQAVYSPDGRHLATANGNGTTYILRLMPSR